MKREIKFRVWDSKNKHWRNDVVSLFNGAISVDGYYPRNQMVVMQYTGNTTLHFVDIYEGDLVFFDDGLWVVRWDKLDAGFKYFGIDDKTKGKYTVVFAVEEIVGNIHENPELFNKLKQL